MLGETQL